jgi:hypothetical protein
VNPNSLGIKGSTQPEIFRATVDGMAQQLRADPAKFWQDALANDGPIEIWVINGEHYLFNGNHRCQAALQAGVDIPGAMIRIVDKTGSQIPTFLLKDVIWLAGVK